MEKNRHPLYRLLRFLSDSPFLPMEWLQYGLFAAVLILTLTGFGGFLPFAAPMVPVGLCLLLLGLVHFLYVFLRGRRPQFRWAYLFPLPLLAVAYVGGGGASEDTLLGVLHWGVLAQASAIFVFALTMSRQVRGRDFLFGIVQAVIAFAVLAGFFQYYLFPDWFPHELRERVPDYAHGAAGFLVDPRTLGALILLVFPYTVSVTWFNRYPGPVRMLSGFLILVYIVGFVVTSYLGGLWVGLLALLILPVLLLEKWSHRWRMWMYLGLAAVVILPVAWFGTDALQERIVYFAGGPEEGAAVASREAAMSAFGQSPLQGLGLGRIAVLSEQYNKDPLSAQWVYPYSAPAGLLAELGMVGLAACLLPLGTILWVALGRWKATPYFKFKKDVEARMNRMKQMRRRRHRRGEKKTKDQGRTPSTKVYTGSLVAGIILFLLYSLGDYSLYLPLHQFVLATTLGVLAVCGLGKLPAKQGPRELRYGFFLGLVPLVLLAFVHLKNTGRLLAQSEVYHAEEQLEQIIHEPDWIFDNPSMVRDLVGSFERALDYHAGHPTAHLGAGRARMAIIEAGLETFGETGKAALAYLDEAVVRAPNLWLSHFSRSRALALAGAEYDQIIQSNAIAMSFAPQRIEPMAYHAALLLNDDPESVEGADFLARAQSLSRGQYMPLEQFLKQTGGALQSVRDGRLLEAGYIAATFKVIPEAQAQATLGAGRFIVEAPEIYLPEE
jgi:hypothetical protein